MTDFNIGKIKSFIYLPGHELANVQATGSDTEVLIPINEDLIVEYDETEKTISLMIAEGVLEL